MHGRMKFASFCALPLRGFESRLEKSFCSSREECFAVGLLVLVECLAVGLLAVVECLALGLGETVGAASVLLPVSKPEALSRVFVHPSDLEQPAAGLRWVLAYLLLGLCVSVGLKVGVKKLCFCFRLGRVDCARKGSRKRRLPRNPKLRLRVWNRWMRVEVACARMMRARREPAAVKLGNASRKLAEEVILEAVSHVLMGVNFVLRLLACLGRKMKAWFLGILPFEVRWKSRSSQDCELCFGLPVEVQVEDSDEELIPDPFSSPDPPAESAQPPKRPRKDPPRDDPPPAAPVEDPVEPEDVPISASEQKLSLHRRQGHQPYWRHCDVCQSARGKIPARRRGMKSNAAPGELQMDFGFFGRHVRFLVCVHVMSGYLSTVVLTPDEPVAAKALCKIFSEMGLHGLDVVVHGDQENLLESVCRDAAKDRTFVGRSFHWVPFAKERPQSKGIVERHVGLLKESFWSVWLGLEERVGGQLALGGELFAEGMRYTTRMYNLYHIGTESQSSPLERLRGTSVVPTRTYEFGSIGFGKPQTARREHRGKRLVRCIYVGPQGPNGHGIRAFVPLANTVPRLELMGAYRSKTPTEFDVPALKALLGSREDPERPIKFDVPPDAPQPPGPPSPVALPDGSVEFPKGAEGEAEVASPGAEVPDDLSGYAPSDVGMDDPALEHEEPLMEDGDEGMDVDGVPDDEDDAMEEGLTWLQEFGLALLFDRPDLRVRSSQSGTQSAEKDVWFSQKFGGTKIWVKVPANVVCEVSGAVLAQKDVVAGMKLELEELDAFSVVTIIDEKKARKIATRRIHTTRWVITAKPSKENPNRVRARLVVRDYALGSSPLAEGIYSPTTSLEALRGVLAIHAVRGGTLLSADVSVAFMQAPVQGTEVIKFPLSMVSESHEPLFGQLFKAMNGLRIGPLSWYIEFTNKLRSMGFQETADPTVHRRCDPAGLVLILCYVDDLIVYSEDPSQAEEIFRVLAKIYKMKRTGVLKPREVGTLEFLGRVIVRLSYDGPILFGLKPGYLSSLGEEFQISAGKARNLPNLERLYKGQKESVPISREAYERYRRVLGKLMWASLTLAHLQYPVGFLGRFQQDPDSRAENCLRAVVRWITVLPEFMQEFHPSGEETAEKNLTGYVDASWNVVSVSGALLCWRGMMLKSFSRKQATTALSSAEAELIALVEASKEAVYVALLMETLVFGLEKQQETGSFHLVFLSDSEAAISISAMSGLLRRVRHLELRARYLQELVTSGRLVLRWISGELNPSDGLTKSVSEDRMLQTLLEGCGLVRLPQEDVSRVHVALASAVDSVVVAELPSNLEKYLDVAQDLARGIVPLLVIELFCGPESAISQACRRAGVAYIGITAAENFVDPNTQEFLAETLSVLKSRYCTRIYVHIATPCTAGCSWRHYNLRKPGFKKKWQAKLREHQRNWKLLGALLGPYAKETALLVTQEWPKTSALWKEEVFLKIQKRLGLSFGKVVDRCSFDGVYKKWYFCSNHEKWVELFKCSPCDGMHTHVECSLYESGFYPTKLGRALVTAARKLLGQEGV